MDYGKQNERKALITDKKAQAQMRPTTCFLLYSLLTKETRQYKSVTCE